MEILDEGKFNLNYLMLLVWRFNVFFIKYNSIKKFKNYCLIKLQKKIRTLKVRGHPYELIIESSSVCNLRCPGCLAHSKDYHHGLMNIEKFKEIVDIYKDYVYNIELFSWGEPLYNKEIFKMIRYAKDRNIFVRISSNFNKISDEGIEEIIESKLDLLKFAVDGTSQESYGKYRINGDFKLAMKNVKKLLEKRKSLKSETPLIEWQFIVNRYNEHEMEKAKEIAKELGIDRLRFMNFSPIHINSENNREEAERWLPKNKRYRFWESSLKPKDYVFNTNCTYLWQSLTVSSEGKINLCPNRIGSKVDCAEVGEKDFWNKNHFTKARNLFRKKTEVQIPCSGCREFKQKI